MKSLVLLLLTLLLFFPAAVARADSDFIPLVPGGRDEYRFEYSGDRTTIEIALDAPGATGISLYVYTPAQMQAAARGEPLIAVGKGTPNNRHEAFWAGGFNTAGVYYVAVENASPGVILYRLTITGQSVRGVARLVEEPAPTTANLAASNTLVVNLPPGAGIPALHLNVPRPPATCTHSYQVPVVLSQSIKLCPDEVYPPLRLVGNNLAVYADEAHSAVVTAAGRQYAITAEGNNLFIEGVTIQASADAADQGAWLCQYEECVFPTQPRQTVIHGGVNYGGGILLRGSYSTIHGVTVRGGTIGIATVNGVGNNIVDNRLDDLNGWGSFNVNSRSSYFVGNTFNRENHACQTPDGRTFLHGCETAGWTCIGCTGNVIARNHCEASGNCYYLSGERGLASNDNRLLSNYCAGATDNCFELTFSRGNILQDNIATALPETGAACMYPFWIGGSTVYFKNNLWQCTVSANDALAGATASTSHPTLALELGAAPPLTGSATTTTAPRPTAAPSRRGPRAE